MKMEGNSIGLKAGYFGLVFSDNGSKRLNPLLSTQILKQTPTSRESGDIKRSLTGREREVWDIL